MKMIIYRFLQLVVICQNKIKLLKFLLDKRVQKCPRQNCRRNMSIICDAGRKDRFVFTCSKCRSYTSIRKGSYFEQSKLSYSRHFDILRIVFSWSAKVPHKSTEVIADVCINSVCQWYQFLREKWSEALLNDPNYVFGGNRVVVQID